MALHAARRASRARDVRAGVDATVADASTVLRATGVPEAHERGGRTAVRAHAHGSVVKRQALAVSWARATAVARAPALAMARAPQMRCTVTVHPALTLGGCARQLAQFADGEPVPARAPGPVVPYRARLGWLAH